MTPLLLGILLAYAGAFVASGWVMLRAGVPRPVPVLALLVAALVLAGVGTGDVTAGPGLRLVCAAGLVVLPALVLVCPDGRPHGQVDAMVLGLTTAAGALAVAYPTEFASSGATPAAQLALLGSGLWWRYDSATGPGADRLRGAVLWMSLVGGLGLLIAGHLAFLADNEAGAIGAALVTLPFPAAVAIGAIRPDLLDVQAAISRTTVDTVALVVLISTVVGVASTVQAATGRTPSTAATAVIAALCALGLQPVRTLLRGTVDRLLFGDRDDPVLAASHVGAGLAVDLVLALRALREALGSPYAALRWGGREVARSGTPSTEVQHHDLVVGGTTTGRLEVGLRAGQVRPHPGDRTVLQVVAPALAQALHAQALTRDLQESRAEVVAVVEDERRRLRRDLHDGLGPTLTGIAYAADAARNTMAADPARAAELMAALRADATDAIAEVRRLVEGLRPPAVDELGLLGALRQQVRSVHNADGSRLTVRLEAPAQDSALPAAVEVAAYRIVTEALTNVARHAAAREASVRICTDPAGLHVEVLDSGEGGAVWAAGVGLTSMRARAEELGGTFEARGGPHGGLVRAVLPLS